jgi:uracil-DNA glycosylase
MSLEVSLQNFKILEDQKLNDWKELFETTKDDLSKIFDTIISYEKQGSVTYPFREDIFKAFELTPPKSVKIIILSQDPYHSVEKNNTPTAQGLAFSVRKTSKIPPSLANIYKEIKREYPDFQIPQHGDLTGWATQGVLLLNASLTVEKGKAGSHGNIWLPFIEKVVKYIDTLNLNAIWVLWGRNAEFVKKYLKGGEYILTSSHPSPFSVGKTDKPFNRNDHFLLINQRLRELGEKEIDWQI